MRYYTLDRTGRLSEGMILGLVRHLDVQPDFLLKHVDEMFPEGVTEHGNSYFLRGSRPANSVESAIELLFEYVRRSHYPDRPSRFQSVFAFASVEETQTFRKKHGKPTHVIWEVEATLSFKGNMGLLTLASSLLTLSWRAHEYWRGQPGKGVPELWECLLVPPVTIVRPIEESRTHAQDAVID